MFQWLATTRLIKPHRVRSTKLHSLSLFFSPPLNPHSHSLSGRLVSLLLSFASCRYLARFSILFFRLPTVFPWTVGLRTVASAYQEIPDSKRGVGSALPTLAYSPRADCLLIHWLGAHGLLFPSFCSSSFSSSKSRNRVERLSHSISSPFVVLRRSRRFTPTPLDV